MRLLFLCILYFSLIGTSLAQSVFVSSSVDRNEMRPGDTFTLSLSVESEGSADIGQPEWPSLTGFQSVNTWSGSQIQSVFENNRFITKRKQMYHLQLQALKEGDFTISPIQINVNGDLMSTKPIRIVVSQSASAAPTQQQQLAPDDVNPFGGGGIDDIFNQMLQSRMRRFEQAQPRDLPEAVKPNIDTSEIVFVDSEVDKRTVYEGEQITVSFYLYSRGQISDIDTLKYPTLAGFWKEDIEVATRLNFKNVSVNGVPFQRALLASYALFPIKAGNAKIDPYTAKLTLMNFNPFGNSRKQVLTKSSEPIDIKVLALPAENKPEPFTGGVGDFKLESSIDNRNPEMNQPITLKLRFEGRGNAKLIELPELKFNAALEVYDNQNESAFYPNGTSFKEFKILLIPRQAGEINLESFSTSFFSSTKKQYYQLDSESFVLNVTGSSQQKTIEPSKQSFSENERVEIKPQLPPLILKYEDSGRTSETFKAITWGGLYSLASLMLMAFAYIEFGRKEKREKLRSLVQKRIQKIEALQSQGNFNAAASETINLIYFTLGELSEVGGGSEELEKMLLKAPPSFRAQNSTTLLQLMKKFETLAYAPKELLGELADKKTFKANLAQAKQILIEATKLDFSNED